MPDNKSHVSSNEDHNQEYHVASFIAHAMATALDDVQQEIKTIEGAEIHAVSPEGKIVFTIEDFSQKGIGQKIDTLKYHAGLMNLSPVYHQFLPENNQAK